MPDNPEEAAVGTDSVETRPRPVAASTLSSELMKAAGGALTGYVATTLILLIPSLIELRAAQGNANFAYLLAGLVSPPELGIRLLVALLPGAVAGLLIGYYLSSGLVTIAANPKSSAGDKGWMAVKLIVIVVPVGYGIAEAFAGASGQAALGAASAACFLFMGGNFAFHPRFRVPLSADDPSDREHVAYVAKENRARIGVRLFGFAFAAAGLAAVVFAGQPFPDATFKPTDVSRCTAAGAASDNTDRVHGKFVKATDSGVWFVTHEGRSVFCAGAVETLTVTG